MHTIDELHLKLLSELREIADSLEIKNAKKLSKQELIGAIMEAQTATSNPENDTEEPLGVKRKRTRIQRQNAETLNNAEMNGHGTKNWLYQALP